MNIIDEAYRFSVKARGYDEKSSIIRNVAKEIGMEGLIEFADLIKEEPDRLAEYAGLERYYKDKNRIRRQRKPEKKDSDYIDPEINKQMMRWEITENYITT